MLQLQAENYSLAKKYWKMTKVVAGRKFHCIIARLFCHRFNTAPQFMAIHRSASISASHVVHIQILAVTRQGIVVICFQQRHFSSYADALQALNPQYSLKPPISILSTSLSFYLSDFSKAGQVRHTISESVLGTTNATMNKLWC